ncbi:MAG: hypothetical protein OXU21_05000 [Chloroflexota bacterium]|nr:hypothetical protein [Chloroflexota bacterium]
MAASFLTRAVLQQITQRVLANVIEQLPQRLAAGTEPGTPGDRQAAELPRLNALAVSQLQTRLAEYEAQSEAMSTRMERIEREMGWKTTVRIVGVGVLGLGLGFLIAVAVGALGWIG